MKYFIQDPPILENQFTSDEILQTYFNLKLKTEIKTRWRDELQRFGERVIKDVMEFGRSSSNNEPYLEQYDSWGNRIDKVIVDSGWVRLKEISAEEGLISLGYDASLSHIGRIIQFIKLYLFTPSSAIYTCPLAMTDGAAQVISQIGTNELKEKYLPKLLSTNKNEFWVSGQWMTEKTGGSDLAHTETIAEQINGNWILTGPKWFTSAITADMTMTLARIKDEKGQTIEGSKGLSIFMLELKKSPNEYNNLQINRLKEKLGTRALPTGEVDLLGSSAQLIGEVGKGVKNISIMLNITRIYNSISAVSLMRRAYALAKDYADRRKAFGKDLINLPLHLKTLTECYVQFSGCFHLTFYVVELLGKKENGAATENEELMLRLFTPIVKLFTAKQSISVISELLECMGGMGYLEDSYFPELLRDAQVLSIWEGTTNVLSLDVIRSIFKDNSFSAFIPTINQKLDGIKIPELISNINQLKEETSQLGVYHTNMASLNQDQIEANARQFALNLANLLTSTLLIEFANLSKHQKYVQLAKYWMDNNQIKRYASFDKDILKQILD